MEVAHLEGTLLDYWVSRASEVNAYEMPDACGGRLVLDIECVDYGFIPYNPSSSWRLAGPIIEQNKISVEWTRDGWKASKSIGGGHIYFSGEGPLIAAMRCFVASKLGKTVPDSHLRDTETQRMPGEQERLPRIEDQRFH